MPQNISYDELPPTSLRLFVQSKKKIILRIWFWWPYLGKTNVVGKKNAHLVFQVYISRELFLPATSSNAPESPENNPAVIRSISENLPNLERESRIYIYINYLEPQRPTYIIVYSLYIHIYWMYIYILKGLEISWMIPNLYNEKWQCFTKHPLPIGWLSGPRYKGIWQTCYAGSRLKFAECTWARPLKANRTTGQTCSSGAWIIFRFNQAFLNQASQHTANILIHSVHCCSR